MSAYRRPTMVPCSGSYKTGLVHLAGLVEHVSLDLGVGSLSPTLTAEFTLKKKKNESLKTKIQA